jgi:hypothetical protein
MHVEQVDQISRLVAKWPQMLGKREQRYRLRPRSSQRPVPPFLE